MPTLKTLLRGKYRMSFLDNIKSKILLKLHSKLF